MESKTATNSNCGSESDYRNESKEDNESLHEAYEKMYTQWLSVWALHHALNGEIQVFYDVNVKAEGKISELELLLVEKYKNLKSVTTELERTQKSLRLLSNGSSKLDHLITTGKSFGDHGGIGFKGESSDSKTIFINSSLLDYSINISMKKPVVKYVAIKQPVAIDKSVSDLRQK